MQRSCACSTAPGSSSSTSQRTTLVSSLPLRQNRFLRDLERIEVLEGPQGTLFGGGAQAGAIRYIANKPKLDATTGDVSVRYGITAGGGPNMTLPKYPTRQSVQPYSASLPRAAVPSRGARECVTKRISGEVV
jgi:hypothetical protein